MTDVMVRRFIAAPREEVFAAWLDPASQAQWMLPGDVTLATIESDPRAGGKFRIVMEHGGNGVDHWGEYLTIDPPSLLSFTWISAHTNRLTTIVTIEFREHDGGTELILTHRGLPPEQIASHEKGWGDIVRNLERIKSSPARA
jgi:uncharacterized protein YndB with AHSA1/START domain